MLQLTPELITILRAEQGRVAARLRKAVEVRPKARQLNKRRMEELADRAAVILRAGDPTMFEYEGACRQGLRIYLIFDGWSWFDADSAAGEVLAAAFKQIGLARPSWMEGQPEIAANQSGDRYFCLRCGTPIPEERKGRGVPAKYCSDLCCRAMSMEKARRSGERVSLAAHLARCAAQRERMLEERAGDCRRCGTRFLSYEPNRKYCSQRCSLADQTVHAARPCDHCGETFKPKGTNKSSGRADGATRFCSVACYHASRAKPRPERQCAICLSIFSVQMPSSKKRYCSSNCVSLARSRLPPRPSQYACEETT